MKAVVALLQASKKRSPSRTTKDGSVKKRLTVWCKKLRSLPSKTKRYDPQVTMLVVEHGITECGVCDLTCMYTSHSAAYTHTMLVVAHKDAPLQVKGRIDARNSLETYCYNMKSTIEDKLGDKTSDDEKATVGLSPISCHVLGVVLCLCRF